MCRAAVFLCWIILIVAIHSGTATPLSLQKDRTGDQNGSVQEGMSERLIVTLKGPRPRTSLLQILRKTNRRKSRGCSPVDLASIKCDLLLSEVIKKAKHCSRSDSILIDTDRSIDSGTLLIAIYCIADHFNEDLEALEDDHEVSIFADGFNGDQWYFPVISAFGSRGTDAWDVTRGSDDVIVAIIDTGVDYTHPDLRTNMWINTDNGIDDDQNGYIDDVFGYDFANDDNDPQDDNGHGTHCAGIIGGVVNIKHRVSGISPNVRLMAIKAISRTGNGKLSDIIAAVEYSLDMGAQITSNSFGAPGLGFSFAFDRLLRVLEQEEQLYVAAAGNRGADVDKTPELPASLNSPIILSVAATTKSDRLAEFSNYGARSIDLGAPGVDILSTKRLSGYKYARGTSTATPLVAATAALVLSAISRNTSTTTKRGQEVKDIIMTSVDPISDLASKTVSGGRLNAARAVLMATSRYTSHDIVQATEPNSSGPVKFGIWPKVVWLATVAIIEMII